MNPPHDVNAIDVDAPKRRWRASASAITTALRLALTVGVLWFVWRDAPWSVALLLSALAASVEMSAHVVRRQQLQMVAVVDLLRRLAGRRS